MLVLYYTVLSGLSAICVVKVIPFYLVTGFSYYVMSCYLAINSEFMNYSRALPTLAYKLRLMQAVVNNKLYVEHTPFGLCFAIC